MRFFLLLTNLQTILVINYIFFKLDYNFFYIPLVKNILL